jgi:hypothetical protein
VFFNELCADLLKREGGVNKQENFSLQLGDERERDGSGVGDGAVSRRMRPEEDIAGGNRAISKRGMAATVNLSFLCAEISFMLCRTMLYSPT